MTLRKSSGVRLAACHHSPTLLGSPNGKRRFNPIWHTPAYRFGLWLGELAKQDAKLLYENRWSHNDADQLLRAVEAISANLAEVMGAERVRIGAPYYDYARSTARESRDWYFKARHELRDEVFEARIALLDRVIRILNAIIPRERGDGGRGRRRDPEP